MGRKDAGPSIEVAKRLTHREWYVREAAVRALGGMGEFGLEYFDKVKELLEDEDYAVRVSTVTSLRAMGLIQDAKAAADIRLAPLRNAKGRGCLAVLRHCIHTWIYSTQQVALQGWKNNNKEDRLRSVSIAPWTSSRLPPHYSHRKTFRPLRVALIRHL